GRGRPRRSHCGARRRHSQRRRAADISVQSRTMSAPEPASSPVENKFCAADILEILRVRNWLAGSPSADQTAWCERAAALLGAKSADATVLEDLLLLIFHYDAQEILSTLDAHVVLSRYAARDVIRKLANLLLDPAPLTTDGFSGIVDELK